MRDLLNQDRALSPALIKTATAILGALLAVFAALVVLMALGTLFSGYIFQALLQLTGGLALALFTFLVVRLLGELLMASYRLNDRMTIFSDGLKTRSEPAAAAKPKPAVKPAPKPAAPAKPTERADAGKDD